MPIRLSLPPSAMDVFLKDETNFPERIPDDGADRMTGVYSLTEQEIANLREAWKVVEQAPLPVSKLFFKELFDQKPDYQKKFKNYHGGTSLLHRSDFIPHMRAVVSSLNSIIRNLENEKSVDRTMEYIASSHKGGQVRREEFMEMGGSIKKTLKQLNPRKFSSDMEAAFDKFWAAFVEDYVRRLETIEKQMPKPEKPPPAKK